ncbi:MAG: penicillin-binding protein 2 [Rhodospirillaceae bacterium]|nr:MAG: penicillin-binding protein 2 [Rhodospirillaceae bacterium]
MNKHQAQTLQKVFSRRVFMLGGGQVLLLSLLFGRMYYLQVVEADKYRMLSDENRINRRLLPPPRGLILDRFGLPLAGNFPNYQAMLIAEQSPDLDQTLGAFGRLVPISEHERRKISKLLAQSRAFTPIAVKQDLNWEQLAEIELNLPDLPGISIDVDQKRYYPFGGITSHIIGYVAAASDSDVAQDPDPLLQLPGFRLGRNGLEKQYDLSLRGKAGESQLEVNSVGRIIRELSREEGLPGADLVTTLDIGLQQFAHQRLSSELSGAAVVMDIFSGDVLAMASTPSYDPAAFYRGLTPAEWQELAADIYGPLTNKATAGQYPPGSTFKLMTALAALKAGINPSATVFCSGVTVLGNARFHCWRKEGHGTQAMTDALKNSCDVYFYEMGRRIGIDSIAAMARDFGLGEPAGIDLPGEKGGLIPDRAWKKATMGESWHQGETLVNAIGQGFVQATPLQLCVMAARIANGGYAVKPHLVRLATENEQAKAEGPSTYPPIEVDPDFLRIVRTGMDRVSNEERGTAFRARIAIPGMELAGKTGSSQVRRISMAERSHGVRKNDDLPWHQRDHALFVCFAPVHAPRYACCVVVEHGGGGAAVAAPIARDIMIECQRRDPSRRNPNIEGGRFEMP